MSTTALQTIAGQERARAKREATPYAVARERFTYTDRVAGPVTIAAGELVYDLGHGAIAARPDAFDIVGGKRSRSSRPGLNSAVAPSGSSQPQWSLWPRGGVLRGPSWALGSGPERGLLPGEPVERRSTTSPFTVCMSRGARDAIARICRCVPPTHEVGGMLIADESSRSLKTINLVEAWEPASSFELRRGSMELDWTFEHSRARDVVDRTDGRLVLSGFWHTHPGGGDGPSEPDLRMFGAAMRHANDTVWPLNSFVGLIATEVDRIGGPELTAWVTREDRYGRLICERAVIA